MIRRALPALAPALMLVLHAAFALPAAAAPATPAQAEEAKQILIKSVGFATVQGRGQVPAYAAWLASLLRAAGFAGNEIEITPVGETATLTATLKGTTRAKPILLLGHMDVVEAVPKDWVRDPFVATEAGGYVYGRGAEDNKYDVTLLVSTMSRLKREGFKPKRDIVLVLSGDEETDMATSRLLAQKFKGAELVLNGDSGGGLLGADGKPVVYGVQAGEKSYADIRIEFTDAGGHSSAPTATNPIYRLAAALQRIGAYHFPNKSNELTRASLAAASAETGGEIGAAMARYAADPNDTAAADLIATRPEHVGKIRTTCTATMANAGHAENALPQRATANINCRIFPGTPAGEIKAELTRVVADPSAAITIVGTPVSADASPLRKDVMDAVTRAVHTRYPDVAVAPHMSAGATDSLHFRALGIPSYGVSALFTRAEDSFAHGLNERVPVGTIGDALGQWHSVLIELGSK